MDIEGSMFTSNDLISFRYPLNSAGSPSPCSSSSVLLSSPWPISSSPSPPSSTSSTSSPPSLQPLNEGTILSLSSSSTSPPSSVPSATSPVPMELGLGTGATTVIFTTTTSAGLVSATASPPSSSRAAAALTLVDPVSSHALEVAHAPGKSILCVHEQDHGDLIHFSTSSCSTNRVNGNGNEELEDGNRNNISSTTSATSSRRNNDDGNGNGGNILDMGLGAASVTDSMNTNHVLIGDKNFIVQNGLLSSSPPTSHSSTSNNNNTDGNLFPTLILTSASTGQENSLTQDHHQHHHHHHHHNSHMIPMRLFASLTSGSPTSLPPSSCANDTNTINGSILTNALGNGGEGEGEDRDRRNGGGATCILMTTTENHDDAYTLTGFTSTNDSSDLMGNSTITTLGTTTILMNDYGEEEEENKLHDDDDMTLTKLSSANDALDDYKEYSSSHGKLKDILMNGHNHHQTLHQHNLNNSALLSSAAPSTNGDSYILRDLEAAAVIYNREAENDNRVTSKDNGAQETYMLSKEENDDLEELKLHSVCGDDQSSFTDAINSIYNSTAGRNPFCDGNGDLTTINNGDLVLVSGQSVTGADGQECVYSSGVITSAGSSPSSILAIPPASLNSRSENNMATSVIWTNSGGVVEAIGGGSSSVSSIPPQMIYHQKGSPILLKDEEDIGDLDEIDEDDLLEAKEEREDFEFGGGVEEGDGQGGKGELKCKFCGFVCCSKSSLGIHERRHTGERPFACKYCGRLFNSAQCCKHHERLHTGDKPFQCSYCGKKYAVSTRLKRHERVHTREEPYKCTECMKTFRWFDAFRDHRNTHTGVPLYLCSVCGKTFTSYLKFYYHERGHIMKKERDRDRFAKQREMNGTTLAKKIAKPVPINHTIDILQSLQRNSSASIISALNASAALVNGNVTGKKGSSGGNKSQGQSAKRSCSSKTNSKRGRSTNNNNNNNSGNFTSGSISSINFTT